MPACLTSDRHSRFVIAIGGLAAAVAAIGWMPSPVVVMIGLALGIAVLGVPHGGLDHWVGRRVLTERLDRKFRFLWPLLFFPTYLAIALLVVASWAFVPTATLLGFVILSAWHFGTDDGWNHPIASIALGGLVIWVPAWFRADALRELLAAVMPTQSPAEIAAAVRLLGLCGACFVCLAGIWMVRDRVSVGWGPLAWSAGFVVLPIPVAFGIYFCLWHSVRGLRQLRVEEGCSWGQLFLAVAPLSLAASIGIAIGGVYLLRGHAPHAALTQTVFVGLSAIAVPHMLMHLSWPAHEAARRPVTEAPA